MRLTLRTLLSYLDDTLEPAQAKIIGAKVAESEQARDLMERIKQVTRRRRLTTPPVTGPGGMDANTIGEYLDNDVTAEKAAEVEQICMASDVHLAEVAACHQILTLVLGEPALVPPSAKQRMCGLVKGPEAIPFRKAAKTASKADLDLSSELDNEHDETLPLGVPSVGGKGIPKNVGLIAGAGGGILAACLVGFALWQLLHSVPHDKGENKDKIAQADGKELPKPIENPKIEDRDKPKPPPVIPEKPILTIPPKVDDKLPEIKPIEVVPVKIVPPPDIPFAEASKKHAPIGKYVSPPFKEPAILLQAKPDKNGWARIAGKSAPVFSGHLLASVPGSKNVITLDKGVEVTLWGNLPETTLDPFVWESRATLHVHEILDADLTHDRGRILVRNTKDKDALVRVRFNNPTLGEENHFDLVLTPGAAVVIERFCIMDRDEPFFEDPKNPQRQGPTATMRVLAFSGMATIRSGGQAPHSLDELSKTVVQWQSRQGGLVTQSAPTAPPWFKGMPPLKDKNEQMARDKAIEAHNYLARIMDKKEIDVAVAELVQTVQAVAEKETLKGKGISPDTFFLWRQAIRSSAATDDLGNLFETFTHDTTPMMIRGECLATLQSWLALSREHDYQLLEAVRKSVPKKTPSIKIMELFHMVSAEEARKPATYQHLIEGLNNDLMAIRTLSHWHLIVYLAPAGRAIPYDPAMPRLQREAAVREWLRLIPPGQLPPAPMPPKKDKL